MTQKTEKMDPMERIKASLRPNDRSRGYGKRLGQRIVKAAAPQKKKGG